MLRHLLHCRTIRCGFLFIVLLSPVLILLNFPTTTPPSFLLDHPYFQYDLDTLEPRDVDHQRCVFPRVHPFHPSIWKFLSAPKQIICKARRADWTLVDAQGWLKFNESDLKSSGYDVAKSLRCFWSKVSRGGAAGNVDDVVNYGKEFPVPKEGVKLPSDVEILRVVCRNFANFVIYDRLHAHIRNILALPSGSAVAKNVVNVLIFGLDSMSRLGFIRHLPLTYKYLTEDLKMTVLRGMNKVGDNTYPNLVPLLTGKKAYGGGLPDSSAGYDKWPLIWKNFSRLGYATVWAEDFPDFGLFNYLAKGFRESPTLHYLRPFWLAMKDSPLLKVSSHLCYGTTPRHELQVEYFKQFISTYNWKGIPRFGFSFLAELSHEYLSRVSAADSYFRDFIQWLADTGQLDNTLLVVMSDHGHRFDPIRTTRLGHIEERMPFYAIRLPMTLTSRQPKILDNLLLNSGRLVTPYDIHATLLDLLQFVVSGQPLGKVPPMSTGLGQSLFGEIPANRTCKDASIPVHYCVCEEVTGMDTSDGRALTAASVTVQHVNGLLKGEADKCSFLALSSIKSAHLVKTMEDGATDGPEQKIRVVFEVEPSYALIESTVIVRGQSGEVWGEVSRINPYAGQSDCIRHAILRKFCYCVEHMDQNLDEDTVKL